MTPQDWNASYARALTMALSGDTGDHTRPDDPFLLMINAWWEPLAFGVPDSLRDMGWQVEIDTASPKDSGRTVNPAATVTLTGRSLVLLRSPKPEA